VLTFPELRDAEPDVFSRAATKWQRFSQLVGERRDELGKQIEALDHWTGKGSEAAKGDLTDQRKRLTAAVEQIARIPSVLTQIGSVLAADQARLNEAIATANSNSLVIQTDGTVIATDHTVGNTPYPVPGRSPQQNMPDQKQVAAQLTPVIQEILKHATMADEEAGAALRKLTAQAAGMAPGAKDATVLAANTSIPGPKTDAQAVNKWWDSLSPQQQESLLFMHGDRIGNLDGIPADVRDRANRALLAQQKANLIEMRDRNGAGEDINGKLKGIADIEARLAVKPSAEHQEPYLLKVSTDGTGRAIVAMGNPDTAKNVATYVPGTFATLAAVKDDLHRADQMVLAAKNAGSPSTSVITWVGYEAPQSIVPEAAQDKFADNGKGALHQFQDGLRASHEGEKSHNTVVGHSYGTVLIGHAARDGELNADEAVFVASPGVGVTDVKDLNLKGVGNVADHVYSTAAQYDPIKLAGGPHGPPPTQFTNTFASAPGPASMVGWNQAVHSMYWDTGNPALANMGNIIAGKPVF
jgi:hypothetical protein